MIFRSELRKLKEELDLRFSHRDRQINSVNNALVGLREHFEEKFRKLETNGMATAVNRLNEEVFKKEKNAKISYGTLIDTYFGKSLGKEVTLAGKVDAIIEFLGIDVTIQPENKTPAKAVAKKKAKGVK